jgi:hypothetical protein
MQEEIQQGTERGTPIPLTNLIVPQQGRYFRFQREGSQLTTQVCYWQGIIHLPTPEHPTFRAHIEQKYAPYQQIWAETPFTSENEALHWVTTQLAHEE